MDDVLRRLDEWYRSQCDGDWEHEYGIRIATLDNPGWSVDVSLAETELEARPFEAVSRADGDDWIFCRVENGVFDGSCGVGQLTEVLEIFLRWAESGRASAG
jgi:hypothetical protein